MPIFELELIVLLGLGLMLGLTKLFNLNTKWLGRTTLIILGLFAVLDIILALTGVNLS
ncbi:Uncharacterised protein [uncultured archaeon]|nr:Uncharacterised protein [uncultured archaeon]